MWSLESEAWDSHLVNEFSWWSGVWSHRRKERAWRGGEEGAKMRQRGERSKHGGLGEAMKLRNSSRPCVTQSHVKRGLLEGREKHYQENSRCLLIAHGGALHVGH